MKILDVPQSGSVAGVTSSRNRFGQYRRTRAVPVQPVSSRRTFVRGVFGDLSTMWKTLTDNQRTAWAAYAEQHPRVDSLGQQVILSGLMAFIGHNSLLLQVGIAAESNPPENDGLGATDFVWYFAVTAGLVTTALLFLPPADPNAKRFFSVSRPLSAGVMFNKNYTYMSFLQGDDENWKEFDVLTALSSVIGTPVGGQKLFGRIRLVTGEYTAGPPSEHSQIMSNSAVTAVGGVGLVTATYTGGGTPTYILLGQSVVPTEYTEDIVQASPAFTGVSPGDYRVLVMVGGTAVAISALVTST